MNSWLAKNFANHRRDADRREGDVRRRVERETRHDGDRGEEKDENGPVHAR